MFTSRHRGLAGVALSSSHLKRVSLSFNCVTDFQTTQYELVCVCTNTIFSNASYSIRNVIICHPTCSNCKDCRWAKNHSVRHTHTGLALGTSQLRENCQSLKMTAHPDVVPRQRMLGAVPPLSVLLPGV